jgi:GntR family transcriptional repressor for pyruvate dehydrogenase complex
MVADILRARIVEGKIADGGLLPKQAALIDEFGVSRPSIREAMRILETEGLVSVRRGNLGGAIVHSPNARSAAYMLGLVLQSDRVTLADIATALGLLEPACAALAAARDDRATEVVPRLCQLNAEADEQLSNGPVSTRLAREWHATMVGSCGNQTMRLIVGTLETVWSHHEAVWADDAESQGQYPAEKDRRLVLGAHVKITEAIASGHADAAQRLAHHHLDESQTYLLARYPALVVNITGLTDQVGPFRSR